ncbi:MAG: hypothetical protein OSJ43_05025 [Oscillospiraceae bacterium]|nr:hypothetical protein [Oscillospiraceae bacterium]
MTNGITSVLSLFRVVEKLLEKGVLKPLADIQHKSAFSVLCISSE